MCVFLVFASKKIENKGKIILILNLITSYLQTILAMAAEG